MEQPYLRILPTIQKLQVLSDNIVTQEYLVSTAYNGLGETKHSGQTPRGWHQIRAKIGATAPCNTVFIGRRQTGEIYSNDLARLQPTRDWILTRILWLSGLEIGKNRLGNVDTMQRFIYIHGFNSPYSWPKPCPCV